MKKIICVALVLVLTFVIPIEDIAVNAIEEETSILWTWQKKDGKYYYPVTQLDDDWKYLDGVVGMREATSIPQYVLDDITTSELLDLIIAYPLLPELKAWESYEKGYEMLKINFNGINEYLSREDALDVLVKKYVSYNIPQKRIIDYSKYVNKETEIDDLNNMMKDPDIMRNVYLDNNVYDTLSICECLLAELTDYKFNKEIEEIIANKLIKKISTEYYTLEDAALVINDICDNDEIANISSNSQIAAAGIVLRTPTGTYVNSSSYNYSANLSYDNSYNWTALISTYDAQYVSQASTTFNCHSYAWLSSTHSSIYQHIWLNSYSQFATDPYYTSISDPVSACIITSTGHSGRVIRPYEMNPYTHTLDSWVISKWAGGPMVQHYYKTSPYYSNGQSISYYKH